MSGPERAAIGTRDGDVVAQSPIDQTLAGRFTCRERCLRSLKGLPGWQGRGWTALDPGSRHFPEVRAGSVIALFYLPAESISYDFEPPTA